ncbi:MAG: metallophosphoesterase [Actinobacteria bacterium]|nr:MAG: metallophosphoesterase [Actinomycetota bacterium]
MFRIVQLSDLHCGQQFFLPQHLERAIAEVNEMVPDVVVISGDLTSNGFKDEYALAREYLNRIDCKSMVVIPGNHDSRNVGYVHFEDLFGDRNSVLNVGPSTIVAVDSSEPDLDNGQVGRGRYRLIEEAFAGAANLRIFVLHHHLLPIPGTGRERNIVHDAGDTLECLQRAEVDLVLAGHKHVPYACHFEDLFGDRNSVLNVGPSTIVAVDSSEPDLDNGQVGRGRYRLIEEAFAGAANLRIFVLHHHLLPIPGTGRERNIVHDAGDTLECLQRAEVDLVLAGHKHVPYAWRLEDLFVVNAGTVSSSRLRGKGRPCYNVVEVEGTHVDVWRRYPFHGQEKIIQFSTDTKTYEKYTAKIDDEVRST